MLKKKIVLNVTELAVSLLALTLVLNLRTVWTVMPSFARFNDLVDLMLVASVATYILSRKTHDKRFINGLITTAALLVYMLLYYLHDDLKIGHFFPRVIMRMALICLFCFDVSEKDKKLLFERIELIVSVIACVSLAFWLVGSLLGILRPTGITYITWSNDGSAVPINQYFGIYFETQEQTIGGLRLIRNTAIFTEAPMSSFMFCFGLMIELFKKEQFSKRICILLVAAIVSTFSTTGYAVLIAAFFFKYLLSSKARSNLGAALRFAAVPALLIAAVFAFEYLLETKLSTASGSVRLDDFAAGFKAWMDHPLMGNGYNNSDSYTYYMSWFRMNNTGFSNSLMQILAYGGLYLITPYLMSLGWGSFRMITRKQWNELVFTGLYVFMFILTITSFQMLTLLEFMIIL